jgi:hypothetical protein
MIKTLFILALAGLAIPPSFAGPTQPAVYRWVVQPSSSLHISGRTNINRFTCRNRSYPGADTLVLSNGSPARAQFSRGRVALPAAGFSCGHPVMTNDFQKTIRAGTHPNIIISLLSLERFPVMGCEREPIRCEMTIWLAGVAKRVEMECLIEGEESGVFHLRGSHCFGFSDFNLEVPSKMLGMIRVHETLDVSFHLVLRNA